MLPLLADALLLVHFAFVLFVVASVPLIWAGAAAGWSWVRHRGYRIAHLAAIAFVAAEALLGVMCPLTVWEDALRGVRHERSFIARWVHDVMYYDFPEQVFAMAYVAFALIVGATYWLVPPRRARRRGGTRKAR